MPCLICGDSKADRCHIRSKGAGGSMADNNLIAMCRIHHIEQHKTGWFKLSQKYPIIAKELQLKGWEFVDRFGIIKLQMKWR